MDDHSGIPLSSSGDLAVKGLQPLCCLWDVEDPPVVVVTWATWATSPPFHVERLKNSAMLVSLKKRSYLSTSSVHWNRPRIVALVSENLAVDFDHNFDGEKYTFSTWCPVQGFVLRSLRRLALSM